MNKTSARSNQRSIRDYKRLIAALILIPVLLSGLLNTSVQAQSSDEYQVKAAFLFNFARYVEWPVNAFGDGGPLIIGVIGDARFTGVIDSAIGGKALNGRRLVTKTFPNLKSITACHILFISASAKENPRQIVAAAGPGALTVGESAHFTQMGGMINFTIVDSKVRFEINQGAAERAGLKISSQLLKLARPVRN